jgi:hypothetical protein
MFQRQKSLHINGVSQNKYVSASMKGPSTMPRHCITWYNQGFTVINILFFQQIAGSGTARRKAFKGPALGTLRHLPTTRTKKTRVIKTA